MSESLAVPFHQTFLRVTAPVCLPAILEIGQYFFVNSMATVSAVIFLYSSDMPLASPWPWPTWTTQATPPRPRP